MPNSPISACLACPVCPACLASPACPALSDPCFLLFGFRSTAIPERTEPAGTLRPPCQIRLFRLVWLVRFVRLVWLLRLVRLFRIHVFSFSASEEAQVPFGHQGRQLRAWSELTVCGELVLTMQNPPP